MKDASHVMFVFQTFGIVSGMSDAILGLTFLAWGNSIGGKFLAFK